MPAARRHAARDAARRRSAPRPIRATADARCRRTGGTRALNIVPGSSATATQVLHAVGGAEAGVIYERVDAIPDRESRFQRRRDRLHLARRRRDQRGRVLGSAQHRLHRSACRCCFSSKTTATRSRCRSKCRRRAATSRAWCGRSPACTSSRSTAPISSPACASMREAAAYVRARKGPAFVHARVDPAVLALAVRRREAVQDAAGARGRGAPRSDHPVRRVPAPQRPGDRRRARGDRAPRSSAEIDEAAIEALKAPRPAREHGGRFRLLAGRRSDLRRVRHGSRSPRASPTRWSPRSTAR